MRVTSIDLTNHLSHERTQVAFNGARLVTISGPNGAGKSSLLESLKYVLFDDARVRGDDLVRLGSTDMAVAIEFDFAGGHYRATRGRTTKSGGRSYLELAIADGAGWRPLSGDDIRTTQGRIRNLLGLDADTFSTAVFLGQGQANRFAEATAGDRKKILGQVLGLERYERAERVARDRARDLDVRLTGDRDQVARLDTRLDRRPALETSLVTQQAIAGRQDAAIDELRARRKAEEERVRDLVAQLASYEQAERDVAAVEARRNALQVRFTRTRERRRASEEALAAAEATIAGAADVDEAIAALPGLHAELEELEAALVRVQEIDREIQAKRDALREAATANDRTQAEWNARYEAARRRVDELAPAVVGLAPVVCEKCGHPNVVDQGDLKGQLAAARKSFQFLEGSRPIAPVGLARDEAVIARLRSKLAGEQRAAAGVAELRGQVREVERRAARAEAIEAARTTVTRETAMIADADRELATIATEGKAAATELADKRSLAAKAQPIRNHKGTAEKNLAEIDDEITEAEGERRRTTADVAALQTGLDDLERVQAERDEITARIAGAEVDVARLRRLAAAFGVKGIPARIIESVLPELRAHANALLAELRPGMTLDLRAQRAKSDGSGVVEALDLVVRDGVGERPLAAFSGGERMSVSLAIAVGLCRLVARRAGTAIRSLIVDEPDGLDADARRALGHALRLLAHQGELELVVLVSHHEDLADVGDQLYRVSKNGKGSVVEQVA